jgi:MFS family permease
MAVNQPRDGQGRGGGDPTTAYSAPTQQVRAVDDPYDVDVNVWNRPQVQLLRERVHWGAIWAGLLGAFTAFVLFSLLGLAVGVSLFSTGGASVLPSESTGAVIWETVAGIAAYFIGGFVAGRAAPVFKRSWAALNGLSVFFLSMPFLLFGLLVLGGSAAGAYAGLASAFHITLTPPPSTPVIDQARAVSWAAVAWFLAAAIASYLGGALGTRRRPQLP